MIVKDFKISFILALLSIAKEENKIKTFYDQGKIINLALRENLSFVEMMDDLSIPLEKRKSMLEKSFTNIDLNLLNTMLLLVDKNKFRYFLDILSGLNSYLQEELQIEEGIIYSVNEMTKSEIKAMEDKLSKQFNKKVSLKNYLDQELIGGFRIVINDLIIEKSIKSDLQKIKEKLLNS